MFFDALNELGVPTAYDPNSGQIAGASFLPLDLDPESEIRSTAVRAYYETYAARSNLYVSTGQYVTQILFADASSNNNATVSSSQDNSVGEGSSPGVPGGIFGGTTTNSINDIVVEGKRSIFRRFWKAAEHAIAPRQTTPSPTSTSLQAIGVEFALSAQSPRQNITATREVIVAAGAIHSPQLLMLSGIGPSSTLQAQQIPVNVDLPGVGQNLQDHGQVWCYYPFYNASYENPTMLNDNGTFEADAWIDYWANRTGPLTSGAIGGVAFPSLANVLENTTSLTNAALSQTADQYLLSGTDASVVSGFSAQLPLMIEALGDPSRAGFEILNGNTGALTIGNMRPLSRGYVSISSSDPFQPPTINPRYNSNPIDVEVFLAGIHYNDRLLNTSSLSQMDPEYRNTPSRGATDDELVTYISEKLQTEYHPSGTNAMLPLTLGGVVDTDLLVYGTTNVRVVDTSIIPLLPAAHLQAVAYAVAEKAADIIKAANADSTATTTPAATSSSDSSSQEEQPSTVQDSSPASTTFVTIVATETVYA
ncbi:FAD-linked reductase [Teratosphaeria nubilosa]|uniref:FAD-linked reductase n=1 Tax=Teratosphaeria nubilosa TaxID=161662 RepID=A0A6G1LKC4_9PEZI|nr:FAD-linked reductase [Teratosphaeria nubilosa]